MCYISVDMRLFVALLMIGLTLGFGIGCALGRPKYIIPSVVFVLALFGYLLP